MTRVSACPSMSELSLDISLWSTTTTECSGATGKRLPSSSNPDDATAIFGEKSRVVSVLEVVYWSDGSTLSPVSQSNTNQSQMSVNSCMQSVSAFF